MTLKKRAVLESGMQGMLQVLEAIQHQAPVFQNDNEKAVFAVPPEAIFGNQKPPEGAEKQYPEYPAIF